MAVFVGKQSQVEKRRMKAAENILLNPDTFKAVEGDSYTSFRKKLLVSVNYTLTVRFCMNTSWKDSLTDREEALVIYVTFPRKSS